MGDGVFDGGIERISVRNAVAAHLISSTLSVESLSIAIASVGVTEESKTNVPDLFVSFSAKISSKRSFTFDMRLCTEYLFMSSCKKLFFVQVEHYCCHHGSFVFDDFIPEEYREFLEGFIMFLPIGILLFLFRVLPYIVTSTTVVVLGLFPQTQ